MTLHEYLKSVDMTAFAFADRIGVAPSTVTRIRRGYAIPDLATAARIVDASDGKVQYSDLLAARSSPPDSAESDDSVESSSTAE